MRTARSWLMMFLLCTVKLGLKTKLRRLHLKRIGVSLKTLVLKKQTRANSTGQYSYPWSPWPSPTSVSSLKPYYGYDYNFPIQILTVYERLPNCAILRSYFRSFHRSGSQYFLGLFMARSRAQYRICGRCPVRRLPARYIRATNCSVHWFGSRYSWKYSHRYRSQLCSGHCRLDCCWHGLSNY
jgi:hypothetical protein